MYRRFLLVLDSYQDLLSRCIYYNHSFPDLYMVCLQYHTVSLSLTILIRLIDYYTILIDTESLQISCLLQGISKTYQYYTVLYSNNQPNTSQHRPCFVFQVSPRAHGGTSSSDPSILDFRKLCENFRRVLKFYIKLQ